MLASLVLLVTREERSSVVRRRRRRGDTVEGEVRMIKHIVVAHVWPANVLRNHKRSQIHNSPETRRNLCAEKPTSPQLKMQSVIEESWRTGWMTLRPLPYIEEGGQVCRVGGGGGEGPGEGGPWGAKWLLEVDLVTLEF